MLSKHLKEVKWHSQNWQISVLSHKCHCWPYHSLFSCLCGQLTFLRVVKFLGFFNSWVISYLWIMDERWAELNSYFFWISLASKLSLTKKNKKINDVIFIFDFFLSSSFSSSRQRHQRPMHGDSLVTRLFACFYLLFYFTVGYFVPCCYPLFLMLHTSFKTEANKLSKSLNIAN